MSLPTLFRTPALFDARREVDRLFERVFNGALPETVGTVLAPVVDVRETSNTIELSTELPGLEPEDVEVNIENRVLTISGEKRQEVSEDDENANYVVLERRYGRFERSFTLPRTIDTENVDARFANGILTVVLQKVETAKPRRIEVKIGRK
ncbi:MAG: Hsp20/alpha crystallin family protein [Gemmatimonadetes bacterium]|nr:Hsp20/alpha crystallin family protein [Gemmatimonadota bacterium]